MTRAAVVASFAVLVGCSDATAHWIAEPKLYDAGALDAPSSEVASNSAPWAGGPCANDDDCPASPLVCTSWHPDGFCSAECTEQKSASAEEDECGGAGTTCLDRGSLGPQFCTRTCDPSARLPDTSACRHGSVCTGYWFTHTGLVPDATGCAPYCSTDADCAFPSRCNVRDGACVNALPDDTLQEDGTACDPTKTTPQCRASCVTMTAVATQGLCLSIVDVAASSACPDRPDLMAPIGVAHDNLEWCVWRSCTVDGDCVAPLRCLTRSLAKTKVCTWANPGE